MYNKIENLCIDHPYYCNMGNYDSDRPAERYATWSDFAGEYFDADIDMNLCFRWDINKQGTDDMEDITPTTYSMHVFIMGQRKGIFKPIMIEYVEDKDVPQIMEYLINHHARLVEMWNPISAIKY